MNKLYTDEELINQNMIVERIRLMMGDDFDNFLTLDMAMFNGDDLNDEFLESWR